MQVPGSTSNCGPGFDTLGIALTLHNFLEVELRPGAQIVGRGAVPPRTLEMARETAAAFAREAGLRAVPAFEFEVWGEVPPARGLGSSATVRCGLVAALNALLGEPLEQHALIRLCSRLDGAPDGVAACVQGGFCVSRLDPVHREYQGSVRFELPQDAAFVVVSPATEVLTEVQRAALPRELPFDDAVRTLNSLAFVVSAFATGRYELLRDNVTDVLHQPYRERLCPFTQEAIRAGTSSGAYAGWLSGSGSSVCCMGPAAAAIDIGKAMMSVFQQNGVHARLYKLRADNQGIRIISGAA